MSEISVLVSGDATPKLKGRVISKEGNPSTDDSAAMQFAAIFGSWMAQAMRQGQDSGLQSSDPAGKEANSGHTGIQGLEGMLGSLRAIAGLNLGSASGIDQQASDSMMKAIGPELFTLLSPNNLQEDVTDAGIGSGQLQGGKSPLTELDQYRVIITQLLKDMSGEISKVSTKPAEIQGLLTQLSQGLNLNTFGIGLENSQNVLSTSLLPILTQPESNPLVVFQEQVASVAQLANPSNIRSGQVQATLGSLQSTLQSQPYLTQPELNPSAVLQEQVASSVQIANSSDIQTGLQSHPSEKIITGSNSNNETAVVQTMPLNIKLTQKLNLNQNISLGQTQNSSQPDGLPTGNYLLQMTIQTEEGQSGTGNPKDDLSGNGSITNSKDTGTEGTNSILGNSNLANLTLNSAPAVGNKTGASPSLPVWQQVAQELQAKVLHQLPTVRELNIQLHPAELGQISISLTLDKGQVHMHMLASEAATGQMLKNNFPELREALSQSGVQSGMMQMGLSDSNQNFNQGRNQTFSSQINNQSKQESDSSIKLDDVRLDGSSIKGLDQGISQGNRINVTA